MADRTTKVTLTAQVAGYVAGMKEAAQATRETGSATEKLAQQQAAFEQMGRASMVAGGLIATGLGLSAKAAVDWDSAWAGVTKTVDGSPEQMAALEKSLRDMTGVLPASHEEIAAVAEAAGQLGIQTGNVAAFTRTMIDLGETTNLSANDAATQLARFVNVMGTSQAQVSNLGSALVELGNNYATTESEILEMAMRLSGAGAQIGMSEGQVLGLSTALSSVGIEAEAGGSAMSKVMIDIASSVDKGGARLEQFAEVAGVSASAFAEKWKKDPGEALALFVKGLANAESQGKSTFGILESLGITEVRMRDALLRSASAADQFSDAMATGNKAFGENSALANEAEKRYDTVAAKLDMAKNSVVDMAISLGDHLLPVIGSAAEGVGHFADALSGMDGPMGAVVAWGGVIAAGILLTGGAALAAVPKIAAYKVALETLNYSGSAVQGKVQGIARFLTGPWGVALGLAAVSVAGFNAMMDASKSSAQELENSIKQGSDAYESMATKAANSSNWIFDAKVAYEDLGNVLDQAAQHGGDFNRWLNMSMGDRAALDSVKEFGNALSTLAGTDLPRAQEEFARFGQSADLSRGQLATALDEMPGFKSALIDAADAAGLATDDASLLKLALGEIGPAASESADGVASNSDALAELEGKASSTSEELSELADQIRGMGSAQFDLREANRRLAQSYDDFSAAVEANGWTLDTSTEQGRAVESALDDMAKATLEAAAATAIQTGDQEAANARLAEGRERLIDIIAPYFESRDAAAAYVDQLGLITPEKVTEIIAETEEAQAKIAELSDLSVPDKIVKIDADNADAFAGIDGVNVARIDDKTAYVYGDNADADLKIQAIIDKNPAAKTVPLTAEDSGFWNAWAVIRDTPLSKTISIGLSGIAAAMDALGSLGSANGNMVAYANGGIAAYANGGFTTGIYAGGAPIHKFAEPETLWEAYISGKPSERDRNRQIWVDAGERLGVMQEIRAALAAVSGQRSGVQIGSVQFTNPSQRSQFREFENILDRAARRGEN